MKIRIEKDWKYQAKNSHIDESFTAGIVYDVPTQTAIDAVVAGATKAPAAVELAKAAGKKPKSTAPSSMKKAELVARIAELEAGGGSGLQEALEAAHADIAELEVGRDSAETRRADIAKQVEELTTKNEQLQTDIVSAGKTVAGLVAENNKLEAELEAAQKPPAK